MTAPTILVVDDNVVLRMFVCEALEPLGLTLHEAATLDQALATFDAHRCEAVVTDMDLAGGKTAWPLIESICAEPGRASRLIIYSGKVDAIGKARLANLGVTRIVIKPSDMDELMTQVSEVIGLSGSDGDTPAIDGAAPPARSPEEIALERFGGNQKLYQRFRRDTCTQIREDITIIDTSMKNSDWHGAQSITHSLKSALALLGEDDAAAMAASIEDLLEAEQIPQAFAIWDRLLPKLEGLAASV